MTKFKYVRHFCRIFFTCPTLSEETISLLNSFNIYPVFILNVISPVFIHNITAFFKNTAGGFLFNCLV